MQGLDYIFTPELKASVFGVRGCRILWREMKEKCEQTNDVKNPSELKEYLYSLFYELTGNELKREERFIYIKRYDNGVGNSTGLVSPNWWIMIGIPILIIRFTEGKSPSYREVAFLKEKLPEYTKLTRGIPFPNRSGESQ